MPLVEPSILAYRDLRYHAAVSTTVTGGDAYSEHKLCQIKFSRRDGSVFLSFPYLERATGLLSEATFLSPPPGRVTASFGEAARSTSHLVKFSHHPDGQALFSQDGRVRSEVRRQSFRLDGPIGHLFQLHIYNPRGFARVTTDRRKPERLVLRSIFTDGLPGAVTVHAEWRRKQDIVESIDPPGYAAGPRTDVIQHSTGARFTVFFLGQPEGFPLQEHVLLVSVSTAPTLPNRTSTGLVLLAAYDAHEQLPASPPVVHTGCLIAFYPAEGLDELAARCASVDLLPPRAPDTGTAT